MSKSFGRELKMPNYYSLHWTSPLVGAEIDPVYSSAAVGRACVVVDEVQKSVAAFTALVIEAELAIESLCAADESKCAQE